MANMVIEMGRLTRDPEVRYTNGDQSTAIARYTLAVDRRGRRNNGNDQPTADYIPCVAFGKLGEFAEKYFRQGLRVLVRGHIQTGSYTNRDGQKVYTWEVVVDEQEFADGKRDAAGSPAPAQSSARQEPPQEKPGRYVQSELPKDDFMRIPDGADDEGLPFN